MRSRPVRLAITLAIVAAVLAACQDPVAPSRATAAATGTSVISAEATPPATSVAVSTEAPLAGQTDSDWGRIWDRTPAAFPVYPGSTASEEAETGPVSAMYALPEGDAAAIGAWFQDKMESAGFSTESLSGPMEDGSYILESTGEDAGCRTEVTVAPLGGTIAVTVRYGAACPLG